MLIEGHDIDRQLDAVCRDKFVHYGCLFNVYEKENARIRDYGL